MHANNKVEFSLCKLTYGISNKSVFLRPDLLGKKYVSWLSYKQKLLEGIEKWKWAECPQTTSAYTRRNLREW